MVNSISALNVVPQAPSSRRGKLSENQAAATQPQVPSTKPETADSFTKGN